MKKLFGRILSAAIALSLSLTALALPSSAAETEFEDAYDAVENITVGWNLGNTLDSWGEWIDGSSGTAAFETAWGNPVTAKEMITAVKNAGFNTVRVPVTWAQHIDDEGNVDKAWLDRVNEVVDYVISQDMYCILNTHHERDLWFRASESSYNTYESRFTTLWEQIARRFRNYGEKLIFEAYNEILSESGEWTQSNDTGAYEAANKFNQLFVDTVRITGGNNDVRNLMVQTYSASWSGTTLNRFVMPEDTARRHIIVQVHSYDPQTFTTKDITWATPTKEWGSDKDKEALDELMESLKTFSREIKAPIVIGEFGSMDQNNTAARARHAGYFVKAAYERGIKCIWWDNGNLSSEGESFGLLDRKNLAWKFPAVVESMVNAVPAAAKPEETTPTTPDAPTDPATPDGSADIPENIKALGGRVAAAVTADKAGELRFDLGSIVEGKFISLVNDKAECVGVCRIDGSSFMFVVDGAGVYYVIADTETKLVGDLSNDGRVNALDAAVLLRNLVDLKDSGFKGDFNNDGRINALDAAAILRYSIS
ncbi:MAG: cellulase family glycosylhydrolase [Oscillospiraceae bacterium]|nr:cellulase family glycosylhydrolase [Oscillospiraceae bacterium]